jgi:hypothetical protein
MRHAVNCTSARVRGEYSSTQTAAHPRLPVPVLHTPHTSLQVFRAYLKLGLNASREILDLLKRYMTFKAISCGYINVPLNMFCPGHIDILKFDWCPIQPGFFLSHFYDFGTLGASPHIESENCPDA